MLTEGFGALRTSKDVHRTWKDKGNSLQFFRAHTRVLSALTPWQLLPHRKPFWPFDEFSGMSVWELPAPLENTVVALREFLGISGFSPSHAQPKILGLEAPGLA